MSYLRLSDDFIENVRTSVNIVEVIGNYVDLKKQGENYVGLCPFHSEKTPSFMVNENKQIFKCFGCNESGNVISFLMKMENLSFIDAMKKLAYMAHIDFPSPSSAYSEKERVFYEKKKLLLSLHKDIARFYFSQRENNIDNINSYLKKRNIKRSSVNKFGIGYVGANSNLVSYLENKGYTKEDLLFSKIFREKNNRVYSIFFKRLIFPIFDEKNNVIGFGGRVLDDSMPKYLNSPESIIFKKKENLYGLNLAIKYNSKRLILVEGYMDVISLVQNGIVGAIASLGTSLTQMQGEIIKKKNKKVYICYDMDSAGIKATKRAIDIFLKIGVKPFIIDLNFNSKEKFKDPDDFFKKKTAKDFMYLIENAKTSLSFINDSILNKYDLSIEKNKLLAISEISKEIKKTNNEVERELEIKRISNLTGVSVKAIGVSVYGKYFSPKQFKENTFEKKSDFTNVLQNSNKDLKENLKDLPEKGKAENQQELKDLIKSSPLLVYIVEEFLNMDLVKDEEIKSIYLKVKEENKFYSREKLDGEKVKKVEKCCAIIKADYLEVAINSLEEKIKREKDPKELNLLLNEKIKKIKQRKYLLDKYIKG